MTMIEFLEALHEAAAGATDLQSLEAGFLRLSRSTGEHHVPGCGICQQLKLWAYHAEVSKKQVNAAFTDIAATRSKTRERLGRGLRNSFGGGLDYG